jgi:predicted dehydrogenase
MEKGAPIKAGIIGLGSRGLYCLGRNMAHLYPETGIKVVALHDRNPERMREAQRLLEQAYDRVGSTVSPVLYDSGAALISAPEIDLVLVTTPTDTHRVFTVPALESGKKVYCDKPLAHTVEDAIAIVETEARTANPLIMGFTRRYEASWRRAYQILQEGTIGDLIMIQVRDIIPYHRYLTAWWRRRAWSGGALNDKGSHLFDVFNWFVGGRAIRVHGFGARSIVRPEADAPTRCTACDRDCPYRRRSSSTRSVTIPAHMGDSWLQEREEKYMDDVCVYASGADIYHNGSIHLQFAQGVIASYFYSIFGPHAEDQETLELVGTTGRILLTRQTGKLDVVSERGLQHSVIDGGKDQLGGSHFGADVELVKELRRFCEGAPPLVSARCGLEATRLVAAALRSMDAGGMQVDMVEIPDIVPEPAES